MKITNPSDLRALYGTPGARAQKKVMSSLDIHSRHFLDKSPFAVVSTCDAAGSMDSSPRGGSPGFVKVIDDHTIVIPDSKGNKRIDSLINIVETGRIGTLFFLPGVDETLRINGDAYISTDSNYLELFAHEKNAQDACIVVQIQEVFLHCAKALMRSQLWSKEAQIDRSDFPTMGQMLKDQLGDNTAAESQEDMIKRYTPDL